MIDLRSDTVTKPTAEMRVAMAAAEVGDDVYLEDPTVNHLQERAAQIFAKEAGLFVPSGSMGNQIAIRLHTSPGQEVITEERGHIYSFEMAAMAVISGVLARPVRAENGILTWEGIKPHIRPKVYYRAQTGLISLENTHNMAGGTVYSPEPMRTRPVSPSTSTGLGSSMPPWRSGRTWRGFAVLAIPSCSAFQRDWRRPWARCCSDQRNS